MKRIFVFLFAILLIGCNTNRPLKSDQHFADERACKKINGQLQQVGHFMYVCTWPSTDSGKKCADSKECEGVCEIPKSGYDTLGEASVNSDGSVSQPITVLKTHVGENIEGVCSSIQSKGKLINCSPYVSNGKVTLPQCLD